MNKAVKIIIILLFTIVTLMTLSLNVNPWVIPNSKGILYEIFNSIKDFSIILSLFGVFVFSFYYKCYFDGEKYTKKNLNITLISMLFSIIIVGSKLLTVDKMSEYFFTSFSHLFKCSILFTGLYLMFYAFLKSFIKYEKKLKKQPKKQKKKLNKLLRYIDEHPVITTVIFLFICRLPFLIIHFPFIANGDTFDVLCQIFHDSHSWTIKSINLVNNNVYLNTHHPLLFTLIFGVFVKTGVFLSNLTLGAFLYTLFQLSLSILIFAFLMNYLKKINIPLWLRIVILLFIGFTPTISMYSITAVKDTPSALFTLLYIIFLFQIIRSYNSIFNSKFRIFCFILIMFFVIAFRSNGILAILCSYPFLFILYKDKYKKLLVTLLIPIISLFAFNSIMYNNFDVSKGSKREYLSVPFMQVARLMRNGYDNEFSKEDIKAIDKILDYRNMKQDYFPDISDPIKNKYNKNATDKDLKKFFGVWFKYLCKHPNVYIKSIMASTYQYVFPDEFTEYAMIGIDYDILFYFDVNRINGTGILQDYLDYSFKVLSNVPIIGLIIHVAFFDWILLLSCMYVIYKKKYKYLIVLAPLLSVFAVCFISPLNGSIRYILPIVFSIPMCLVVDYIVFKES